MWSGGGSRERGTGSRQGLHSKAEASESSDTQETTPNEEEKLGLLARIKQKIKGLFSSDEKATDEAVVEIKNTEPSETENELTEEQSKPTSSREDASKPEPLAVSDFQLPELQRGKLSNGIPVIVSQNHEVPLVYVQMVLSIVC